jgi:tRNA(Ile)-lysidine synthase
VYLLRVISAARPRSRILGVHVDHGLRGDESDDDARFCADACDAASVEFVLARAELDPAPSGLEARARTARYAALAGAARAAGIATIVTAHHADDALETLILRWLRGSEIAGLPALRPRLTLEAPLVPRRTRPSKREVLRAAGATLVVARPLLSLRRAEIRAALERCGVAWREDSSNGDARFARNAVRHELLPAIARACGPDALENMHAFGRAVAALEETLARGGQAIRLEPPRHAAARRTRGTVRQGGTIARRDLAALAPPVARRALARIFAEASGAVPNGRALDRLVADLFAGRTGWHEIRGGWRVQLRSDRIDLEPPAARVERADPRQLTLPFEELTQGPDDFVLPIPSVVDLGDGRRVTAERIEREPGADFPRDPRRVEMDARALPLELRVRMPRPGDRFHALGAPGSKELSRFLADAGVPRHDRARVPLVLAEGEVIWVAGVRPAERVRVRADTRERVALGLELR